MQKFDKEEAKLYLTKMLKKHKIKVSAWSVKSCGWAMKKTREIKIPQPTNVDRLGVCFHEIFHVIGRKGSKRFEKEFYCDMYAKKMLTELGYETTEWDKRTKWHVLSRIAMAHNRGLHHTKINDEIREFFSEVDFAKWIGKSAFVGHKYSKSTDPNDIELSDTLTLSKEDIEDALNRRGMRLDKSDSRNFNWLVREKPNLGYRVREEFHTLFEIYNQFNLSKDLV